MTTWNKSNRPSATMPIRYAPITEAFPYTKLQAALLQANVEPLYSDDVEAFKARRLKEERHKLATAQSAGDGEFFLRTIFAILSGCCLAAAIGAVILIAGGNGSWIDALLIFIGVFMLCASRHFFSATRRRYYPGGTVELLEWRTYRLGECADSWANMEFEVRGAGLDTATVIPDEIKHRMCLIAGTGVRANFSLEQLDVDPFVWVSDKDERYCIGQFDEQGFVR